MIPFATKCVSTGQELQQIADLNAMNLRPGLTADEIASQGFVTWRYDVGLLQHLAAYAPSIICKSGESVAGYALTAPRESRVIHRELDLMLDKISNLTYEGRALRDLSFYVMGQLCVAREYRGMGVVEAMYELHRESFSRTYDLMVLTIATDNTRSVRVHERIGFRDIHVFNDHFGGWKVSVWDWRKP